jgi:hypothetical protein
VSAGKLKHTSAPCPGSTSEPRIVALAVIYRRAIERYEEMKEGSPTTTYDNDAINTEGDSYAERKCNSRLG